jgi:exonuclease SbcC
MLKSISLQNFQSHKNTELQFDPGVNVIVGPSDSGKSAVLRATIWTIFNRPSGESFKSYWGGDTVVNIVLEKETISREKGKENLYIISSSDLKKPVEFKAFGQKIPNEISDLFNISNINVQKQMDAPFLLSLTPGEVGRILNQAVKLDIIDIAQKNIFSTLRQEKNLLLNTRSIIAEKQEALEKYKWLPGADSQLANLESINAKILETRGLILSLTGVLSEINTIDLSIKKASEILPYSEEINNLITLDNEIERRTEEWNKIDEIRQNIQKQENQIELLSPLLTAGGQVAELIKLSQTCKELNTQYDSLVSVTDQIEREIEKIQVEVINQNKLQTEFDILMPDTCPLCGRN